jgi:SPP1 gp7 family putative phage head morphogenesis protein
MPVQPFGLPPLEAIKLLKAKGFDKRPTFDWRDMWGKDHAAAFTVAKSAGFDILDDIYKAVLAAQEGKINYKTFVSQLTDVLQAKGWWGRQEVVDPKTGETVKAQLGSAHRLDTIYNTNLRTAEAAGRWTQMEALKKERPYLQYVCMNLPTSRVEHKAWHGIVLPKDDPWWDTHYPPNGWNCRCTVFELSEKDLDRYGLKVSDNASIPYNETVEWKDKRNDETRQVSKGVDPAFDYNPGKVAPDIKAADVMNKNLSKLSPELAKAIRDNGLLD